MNPIKYLRESKNISLRKLAKSLDISPTALSKIENDSLKPSHDTLEKIANSLGHKYDLFIYFKMTPSDINIHKPHIINFLKSIQTLPEAQQETLLNSLTQKIIKKSQ